MKDQRVMYLWLVALCSSSSAAPDGLVVLKGSPVSVHRGLTATLPCWISPAQSAEALKVHWYRSVDQFENQIILYKDKQFVEVSQESSYVGRVSFGLKDSASGGLKTGDVSLKLVNVTTEDAGEYICYVSSGRAHDSATLSLLVTAIGSIPRLFVSWKEDNTVNVSCESEGWYPQPVLRWSGQKEDVTPKSPVSSKISSGLHSVHSWLVVPNFSEISCSVGLPNKDAKVATIRLENPPKPEKIESGSCGGAGWVAFGVLLATVILAGLGVGYCFKKKGKKSEPTIEDTGENEDLLPKNVQQPAFTKYYVNVKLEDTTNEFLTIKANKLRDAIDKDFPDGECVTCLTAIKGSPGFSCGQHYWEVSLKSPGPNVGVKLSWWVGVTSAAEIPPQPDFSPDTSNGFWFLSSDPDKADTFQLSTEPPVLLPVHSRPETVGVHLNYDSGELSFYNVEDESLIVSLKAKFTGEVFPFFNPGKGDKAVMVILHREEGIDCNTSFC